MKTIVEDLTKTSPLLYVFIDKISRQSSSFLNLFIKSFLFSMATFPLILYKLFLSIRIICSIISII